ncbi:MAG: hypothetical protein MSA54_04765 [Campylobacter sp.]|uniref:hypothetical protein n=1 Tax=Campylobacter sp. TaxID=205 RepID=UPI002A4E87C9|nr:hypothetical protein [Campylobacter sp.]MDD7090927.1 hypothetical protein [Campylobacteraceae bacterium]MCI7501238.1 hypothetical protein [Campylobacter sp.]MDY3245854.1 hypothetical protein [Campylobacter sp.]MDY4013641.1 hypothetical protein [Campylobacter sp.]MDY5285439.1 hypothetical protein [Campylobacter sp.]
MPFPILVSARIIAHTLLLQKLGKGGKVIRPKSEKLDKLNNSYKLALKREKKNLEKQLNSLSKILVETSIKNENFF